MLAMDAHRLVFLHGFLVLAAFCFETDAKAETLMSATLDV